MEVNLKVCVMSPPAARGRCRSRFDFKISEFNCTGRYQGPVSFDQATSRESKDFPSSSLFYLWNHRHDDAFTTSVPFRFSPTSKSEERTQRTRSPSSRTPGNRGRFKSPSPWGRSLEFLSSSWIQTLTSVTLDFIREDVLENKRCCCCLHHVISTVPGVKGHRPGAPLSHQPSEAGNLFHFHFY